VKGAKTVKEDEVHAFLHRNTDGYFVARSERMARLQDKHFANFRASVRSPSCVRLSLSLSLSLSFLLSLSCSLYPFLSLSCLLSLPPFSLFLFLSLSLIRETRAVACMRVMQALAWRKASGCG